MATVKNRLPTLGQFPAPAAAVTWATLGLIPLIEKEKKQCPTN